MKLIYRKQTGEVVMRTNGEKIEFDEEFLDEIDLEPTKEELKSIENNEVIKIINGKLTITKEEKTADIKQEISEAGTLEELKTAINKLI